MNQSEIENLFSASEASCSELEDSIEYNEYSSDESESDCEMEPLEEFVSKNKLIKYSKQPQKSEIRGRISHHNILNMTPGLTRYSSSSFNLFFTQPMIKIILQYSNMEGARVFTNKWTNLDEIDIMAYIGTLILAGVYKSCNEHTKSLWDSESGRPMFPAIMSLRNFENITRVIRFDNRETRVERRLGDKCAPIRDMWNLWVEVLPKLYNPCENVTIDEQLLGFRGKCPFKQYMPSKPAKYGIKFWILCDVESSYVWNIQIYKGKEINEAPEKNQGMRVVMDLTRGLKGHNVTTDNFFTSHDLGQKLLEKSLTLVGTIRKNKPTMPPELINAKGKPIYSTTFAFTENSTLVSYIPKKNRCVTLLSTFHHDNAISSRADKKPNIILDYNKWKGAVDTLDKSVSNYSCKRKTNRWPHAVFCNMIDISAYNAFVLFSLANNLQKGEIMRRNFLENLGRQLVKPFINRRSKLPRSTFALQMVQNMREDEQPPTSSKLQKTAPKRGRCKLCTKSDNKSSLICKKCHIFACKKHSDNYVICIKCKPQ